MTITANHVSNARTTVTPKRRRPKVKHYYDLADAEAALVMGINEVRTLCKRRWMKVGPRHEPITVAALEGGQAVITNAKARDCLLCIRALRADTERSWRGQ